MMKSIKYQGKTIIAVFCFLKTWEGNHIKSKRELSVTLIADDTSEIEISEDEYNKVVKGSGIRRFSGQLATGGGRHSFTGASLHHARKWALANI